MFRCRQSFIYIIIWFRLVHPQRQSQGPSGRLLETVESVWESRHSIFDIEQRL